MSDNHNKAENVAGDKFIMFKDSPVLTINGSDGEIIRFEQNGDIYVKGKLVENDKDVVDGFREFLRQQGIL